MKTIGILLACVAVIYYFVIYLPDKDRAENSRIQLEKIEENFAKKPYNDCINEAENWYDSLEKAKTEAFNECNKSISCINSKTMDNLLTSEENILKNFEENKKACVIKFKK